jgi:predicted MPP superfamily phosphohydrolase
VNKKKVFLWAGLLAGTLIATLILYGLLIEPNQVGVRFVSIRDDFLGARLENKVVVQLSDLHISSIGKRERRVLAIVNELKPDIIFLTGDYVSWNGDYVPALTFLSLLRAKIGMWAVMGDYDYSRSRSSCLFCHEEGSGKRTRRHAVRFLKDSSDVIRLPEGSVRIAGVDGEGGSPFDPKRNLVPTGDKPPAIILSHSPLNFDLVRDDQNLLMLAGDTHGGQVPLPSLLWSALGYEKNARYSQGFFQKGRKKMFVSRGVGTSHLPLRLFRPPEVVVLQFEREQSGIRH